jgi:ABC-2 type transport system ATP-binding protein
VPQTNATDAPLVRCQDVAARPSSRGRDLSGITLDILPGEFFAVVGPGGSGKSTLLRAMAGLHPITGTLLVDQISLAQHPNGIGAFTSYLAQQSDAPEHLHVGELLFFSGRMRGLPKREARAVSHDLLDQCGLAPLSRLPLRAISRGEERLARFCACLMGAPRLLLLDEPTTGLDLRQRQWLWEMLRQMQQQHKLTVVVATHHIDEIEPHAQRLALLRDGKLMAIGDQATLKERFSKGPRMDLRLVPGATLARTTRLKLEALGELIERGPELFVLYPKPDTIGSLARSIPVTTMAQALVKSGKVKGAKPASPDTQDLRNDAWLLDRQTSLPGSLGRTVEEIFNIIGPQNIAEFWFAPPTLTDVYLHLTGEEAHA